MGTTASLEISDTLPAGRLEELADDVFAFLHAVDTQFSTYRSDSEVSQLSAGRGAEPSPVMREVLGRCTALWRTTHGYFDVYATGRLDPSGFVKGWAAQVASDRLVAAGAANHCVNAGGDVRVRGRSPHGEPWRVAVGHPREPPMVCCFVGGTDLAVANTGV
jgi:thiamine biosynthesis lipoprotein